MFKISEIDFCPTCLTRFSIMFDSGANMYGTSAFCFLLINRETNLQKYPDKTGLSSPSYLMKLKSLSSKTYLLTGSSYSKSSCSVARVACVDSTSFSSRPYLMWLSSSLVSSSRASAGSSASGSVLTYSIFDSSLGVS